MLKNKIFFMVMILILVIFSGCNSVKINLDSFAQCILSNKERILKLKDSRLENDNIDEIESDLKQLYLGLWSLMNSLLKR